MPYITALDHPPAPTAVLPSLDKLQKEGEVGQARITQYTRYLTVGLAFAQSIGFVFLFRSFESQAGATLIPNFNLGKVLLIVISLTGGTVLLMWMGEEARSRSAGSGTESRCRPGRSWPRIPNGVHSWSISSSATFKVAMPIIAVVTVAAIVFVQEGQRRIPIQYAKRVIGRRMTRGGQTYRPVPREHGGRDPGHLRGDLDGGSRNRRSAGRS